MTQLKVGVFIVSGLAVLLTTIFMLGSNKHYFSEVMELHGYFDSVQGLNKGAVVSLAGVKVGNVDDVSYDEVKNMVNVTLTIDKEYNAKIKKDSRMEIRTQGALGDKYIYITPGVAGETVSSGAELAADYGNDILSILAKRGNESEKLFDILDDIKKITGALSHDNHLPAMTANLDKASVNLAQISEQLNKSFKDGRFDSTMTKLEKIVDKIDKGEGTLGALINDRSIHDRIKNMLGAGQKTQQVKSILKSSVEDN
jgi:phospholipid/cholesterol/gamma-HCH transport system substrate-binding protein